MNNRPIFITGTGTGVGKTLVSAIITEALQADYWKPIQAGFDGGTDALAVQSLISNTVSVIHTELYKLKMPASPHIAAREEGILVDLDEIKKNQPPIVNRQLVIEGAGGIMVPLNEHEFVIDIILKINARVILVSRNYLGSINHSLLTAALCRQKNIDVIGWIFNDQYLHYENEIIHWSGYPGIANIPLTENPDKIFIRQQAQLIKAPLQKLL